MNSKENILEIQLAGAYAKPSLETKEGFTLFKNNEKFVFIASSFTKMVRNELK